LPHADHLDDHVGEPHVPFPAPAPATAFLAGGPPHRRSHPRQVVAHHLTNGLTTPSLRSVVAAVTPTTAGQTARPLTRISLSGSATRLRPSMSTSTV
jgi:hypothetical protein